MNKKSTNIVIAIAIIIILVVLGVVYAKNKSNSNKEENAQATTSTTDTDNTESIVQKDTDIILFYGSTCPHCKKVEEYISSNNITKYLKFQNLEVYDHPDNAKIMTEKQALCTDLKDEDKGGVPFLYSSEKCVVGDTDVIAYLKEKAGL